MRSRMAQRLSSRSTATASTTRTHAAPRRELAAAPEHVVIGARLQDRSRFPPVRYVGNRIACFWISWAAGHPIADSQSGFRVYPRAVMEIALGARVRSSRFTMESEILIEAARRGHRTLAVPIPGRYPAGARPSHYRAAADTLNIIAMVATRLLAHGLYPKGLWRSLRRESPRAAFRPRLAERLTGRSGAGDSRF